MNGPVTSPVVDQTQRVRLFVQRADRVIDSVVAARRRRPHGRGAVGERRMQFSQSTAVGRPIGPRGIACCAGRLRIRGLDAG